MSPLRISLVVAACAVVYLAMFWLNGLIFSASTFSQGVDWVFLPSGVRLACVLVFLHWGAVGVALATTGLAWSADPGGHWSAALVTGAISGFAPWVARWLYFRHAGLGADLAQLSPRALITMALLFAIITATMHQVWYWWRGQTSDFLASLAVMALGDFSGCLIVLYALKGLLSVAVRLRLPNS